MRTNADGLPMKTGQNIPLAAGVNAEEPEETLHDKAIPATLDTSKGEFNLRESHDYHERVEWALMQAGLDYADAHRLATEAEHARQRNLGFDPNEIADLERPYIDHALHRSRAESYVASKEVDNQPYRDDDMGHLVNDDEDHRVFYDHIGRTYGEPQQFRALGKVDFVIAKNGDQFSAIEPTTATVWATARTRKQAEQTITRFVRETGLERVKKRIDGGTCYSQQQLKERYGDD